MAVSNVALATSLFSSIPFANSNNKHKPAFAIQHWHSNRKIRPIVSCSVETNISTFPNDFFFGAASSAFQSESAIHDGGRGSSIVDRLIDPDHVDLHTNIDLEKNIAIQDGERRSAAKSLHKYNEDVLCLKYMGMDFYRFSISWPRLFPNGKVDPCCVNKEGVTFYLNLLKVLKLNGIKPIVTLFHFDLPMGLHEKYLGTIGDNFVEDYKEYVDFCFKTFGDHVKHWITINEPHIYNKLVYPKGFKISGNHDDRARYPYNSGYHLLKGHAEAVQIYRNKYQKQQQGKIGITLDTSWFLPYSDSCQDKDAVRRAWDFEVGWFLDPLVKGDYPSSMKMNVDRRLPPFCPEEQKLIKDSFDFIGINYYSSSYAKYRDRKCDSYEEDGYYDTDAKSAEGELIGPPMSGFPSMHVYPEGLKHVLLRLKNEYGNPLIYITENGYAQKRNDDVDTAVELEDRVRINYIRDHLKAISEAIREGANVKGYIVWNLFDCVEFGGADPYGARFGLIYTDFKNDFNRIYKQSAEWLKSILTRKRDSFDPGFYH